MDLIPLIYIKRMKIRIGKNSDPMVLKDFLKLTEDKKKIYIFDMDGLEKDKPNLCTYQRLSSFLDLWVDNGPRNLGDVVDSTMAGATDITLRKKLSPKLYISDIREITENKIFEYYELDNTNLVFDFDGIVSFNEKENIESDFKYKEFIKNMIQKTKVYLYEPNLKNQIFWKNLGVSGLLVDLEKIKEFKNGK